MRDAPFPVSAEARAAMREMLVAAGHTNAWPGDSPALRVLEELEAEATGELGRYQRGEEYKSTQDYLPQWNQHQKQQGPKTFADGVEYRMNGWAKRPPPHDPP